MPERARPWRALAGAPTLLTHSCPRARALGFQLLPEPQADIDVDETNAAVFAAVVDNSDGGVPSAAGGQPAENVDGLACQEHYDPSRNFIGSVPHHALKGTTDTLWAHQLPEDATIIKAAEGSDNLKPPAQPQRDAEEIFELRKKCDDFDVAFPPFHLHFCSLHFRCDSLPPQCASCRVLIGACNPTSSPIWVPGVQLLTSSVTARRR